MARKSPESPTTLGPHGGQYESERRKAGLARLAVHTLFDGMMQVAGENQQKRARAIEHMGQLAPAILLGRVSDIGEGFEAMLSG